MKHIRLAILAVVAGSFLAAPGAAQVGAGHTPGAVAYIQGVTIEGNRQVSREKFRRALRLTRGERFDAEKVEDALKRLFATRQFHDVAAWRESTAHADSVAITVVVSEYPKIDGVRIEGNDNIDTDDLKKEISVTRGTFIRPALLGADREVITDLYKEKGYYRATVHDTIEAGASGRELVYRIDEGEKVSVKHIDFIGVRELDTGEVRGAMKLKEDTWWRGADFKPKELDTDKQRIVELYKSEGFLDAEVRDVGLSFSDDGKDLDIEVAVDEGRRYYVGDVSWSGNDLFPDTALTELFTLRRGEAFDDVALSEIQFNLGNMYWDRGYIYSTVSPVKKVRGDTVDVEFDIAQGNLAHVNEINIVGNTKTAEWVIRRELVLRPGDVFTASRLRRSLREVFNLGFFAGPPAPSFVPANEGGDVDITLRVEEKPAGQFRMGAGFSQLNRISGFIGVSEPNFLGRGLRVSLDWEFSRYRQNVNLGFTEPWLMGSPTRLSLSLFARNQGQVRQQFFSDRRTGFSIGVGRPFPWMDYSSVSVRYNLEQVELSDFSEFYIGPLRTTDWPQTTSTIGLTFVRNSTDSPFHPTTGTRFLTNGRWTGGALGGDVSFQRYEAEFSWYQSLFAGFVLQFRARAGVLDAFGSTGSVPDYELFRLGGNRRDALRGYDFYEVVPDGNAQFVGGRYMNIVSYELSFPLAPPTVYGLFFLDAGNTWNSFRDADVMNLKRGAGLGIRIELPMLGTVGMDYGYGFDRLGGGSWEPHITFGGAF